MMSFKSIGKLFLLLLCFYSYALSAQVSVPQVASSMEFAGMELRLTEQARKDIQSSINALYRSEKFFGIMLERVDLYMPIIETILEENGIPEDFKYLVIQESALIPDAVSSSNAVGFWQFKEASATELDMRVDRQVDERMNIVSATRGAAKYFLRSNAEFDNWLYTLLSYMMGQGGTSRSVDKKHYGARKMTIDGDTHWYIKKFLSHMVAFENAIGKNKRNTLLYLYTNTANKSLRHIAREFDAEEELLHSYNKWLKANHIPDDKTYTVVVPLNVSESEDLLARQKEAEPEKAENKAKKQVFGQHQKAPEELAPTDKQLLVELNDLKGVVARSGDNVEKLASLGDISERRFCRYNDLEEGDKIVPGQFYYFEKKRAKARVYEHVLQPDESLWEVSQKYGIRLKKLIRKNRLDRNEKPKAGRVLWLRFIRPAKEPVEYREIKQKNQKLYASTKPAAAPISLHPENSRLEETAVLKEKEMEEEEKAKTKEKNSVSLAKSFSQPPVEEEKEPETQAPEQTASKELNFLYQPDSSLQERKTANPNQAKVEVSQENSPNSQKPERKVQEEKKENHQQASSEQNTQQESSSPSDSFGVEEPVRFVEEEKETTIQEPAKVHQVKAGETLYALSRKYEVSVQELILWNELGETPVLSIGQTLKVSPPKESLNAAEKDTAEEAPEAHEAENIQQEKNFRYHIVSPGESMYRVARMYNVTIKDIMEWNQKENFDIKEGERLIVGKE